MKDREGMDFEQGYHEWMGKANLWWIKQSLSQVPSGQNVCRPYCIYLSLECIKIWFFSLSVSLLDTFLFVHAGQHQTDVWGQKVIHLVALERIHMMLIEKDQLAIIMITCTIYSAHCLCCIVKILSSLYFILIAIKSLNTVPAFMIKDNMEKVL